MGWLAHPGFFFVKDSFSEEHLSLNKHFTIPFIYDAHKSRAIFIKQELSSENKKIIHNNRLFYKTVNVTYSSYF
jgi:hypothetical protein